jgi:two-component system phosphate regulon sensor histidine kinase PhoR
MSIFPKLLWSALLLVALTLFVVDFNLTRYTAEREVRDVEKRLAIEASVLAGELPATPREDLVRWVREAGRRARARVTLIDSRGVVLADSDHDAESMENHGGRPEVQAAYRGRTGTSIRHSATVGRDLCYVAIPVTGSVEGAVLRLVLPLEEIGAATAEVRRRILLTSLLGAVVALLAALAFSTSFTRRIKRLKHLAEGLLEEPASAPLKPDGNDELGDLARCLTAMAGQIRELIERLNLEAARRQAILASLLEGVLAVDSELRVIFCNDAFARAVGAQTPVPERLPVLELVRDPGLMDLLARVLATGERQRAHLQVIAAAGRSFEVQAAPLATRSKRGAVAVLYDVTEIERLERVRKDFVANVSHELRTPLTAIIGYAETLLDGALEDRENSRKFLEIIRAHAERLNSISADLLSLSEIDSGREGRQREPVAVRMVLETALNAVAAEARRRNVKLISEDAGDLTLTADRVRLEQVLVNLLDNAVKFNRPGGEVRIAARAEDGQIRFEVSDNGIGIPSQDLPRIFERFYRVDKGRSRAVGGTGLGLSIVKRAVEQMKGTVSVESRLGKGSTFTVVLPRE